MHAKILNKNKIQMAAASWIFAQTAKIHRQLT